MIIYNTCAKMAGKAGFHVKSLVLSDSYWQRNPFHVFQNLKVLPYISEGVTKIGSCLSDGISFDHRILLILNGNTANDVFFSGPKNVTGVSQGRLWKAGQS
jgi:hypothetical protein